MRILPATVSLAIASAGLAQVPIQISDGFDSPSAWSAVLTAPVAASAAWAATGGNPVGHMRIELANPEGGRAGGGFVRSGSPVVLGSLNLTVSLGVDARWDQPPAAGGPDLRIVPVVLQSARLYVPAADPLTLGAAWSTLPTAGYPLSAFANASGIPLNLTSPATLGFLVTLGPGPAVAAPLTVRLDNVVIGVVPAPAAAAPLLLAGALALRRRR